MPNNNMRFGGRLLRMVAVACLVSAAFLMEPASAEDISVRWSRSLYAPSYGLDDDRVVTHQSEFFGLYEKWSPPAQFSLYLTGPAGEPVRQVTTFAGCDAFLNFHASRADIGWENGLERLRYFMQVSGCKVWKIMPALSTAKVSHLRDVTTRRKEGLTDSETISREIILAVSRLRDQIDGDMLEDLDLSEDWSIDCRTESECSYDVFDDLFQTLLIDFVAQGDYNKDGVEDLLVRLALPADPFKETFYAGLIFTKMRVGGDLELIGWF